LVAPGDSSLTWNIRHDALHGREADRVLEDVAATCRTICRAHLPRASGYELTCTRLSGPLDGVTITVARANFRAMVSVQRFTTSNDAQPEARPLRLRLVASARHRVAEVLGESRERQLAKWGVSGCVAATLSAGAIALHVAGVLATWGYALLLLPALVGTRVCVAMWIADNLRQRELPASRAEQAQAQARVAAEARDLVRWQRILRELEAQRDAVIERFSLRPFRGLSPARPSESSPSALAPAAAHAVP
jgi:hypothetical protein